MLLFVDLNSAASPYINHFLQPDSIIPDLTNPQALNRYSYVANRPINFNDPTGNKWDDCEGLGGYRCKIHMKHAAPAIAEGNRNAAEKRLAETAPTSMMPGGLMIPSFGAINSQNVSNCSVIGIGCLSNPTSQLVYGNGLIGPPDCRCNYPPANKLRFNPLDPDYKTFTLGIGGIFGVEAIITSDRYGNVYFGGGPTAGKSLTLVNSSFVTGWIGSPIDGTYPDETDTRAFLSGDALNLSAGFLGGGGVTVSPHSNAPNVAGVEGGLYTPQIGGAYTIAIVISDYW